MKFYAISENHLYKKAYRSGNRKASHTLTVYVLRDKASGLLKKRNPMKMTLNRIGISASKKIGGAVQRNRAKRVIREAYRMIDNAYGIKRGYLIVIVPKNECTVCSMKECQRDLFYCLRKLDMIKQKENAEVETESSDNAPLTENKDRNAEEK